MIRFELDLNSLENDDAVLDWYARFGAEWLSNAQKLAAERIRGGTGAYERGFEIKIERKRLIVGNIVDHAIYVEEGTEAHGPIVPKTKKALRWFDAGGAPVFATRVDLIPAMPGKHIIKDAVSETADRLGLNQGRIF